MVKKIWVVIVLFLTSCSTPTSVASSPTMPIEIRDAIVDPNVFEVQNEEHQRVNNCDGSTPTITYTRSLLKEETLFFEVQVEAGALVKGTPIPGFLEADLEAKVRATLGSIVVNGGQQEVAIPLQTPEGEIRDYSVVWKETRRRGTIPVVYQEGTAEVGFEKVISIELYDRTSVATKCDGAVQQPEITSATVVSQTEATITPQEKLNDQSLSTDAINLLFGEANWFCFPDRQDALAVKKLPSGMRVVAPIIKVDTEKGSFQSGSVSIADIGGTVWLNNKVQRENCPSIQQAPLTEWDIASRNGGFAFNKNSFDSIFGAGNWRCLSDWKHGITVIKFPQNFLVTYPFTTVDQENNRFGVGENAIAGKIGTAWFFGQLPLDECP